jgi:hypothetical protein
LPRIVDYPDVLNRMQSTGLRCLYHNSGAFGFADDVQTSIRGWIGPDDQTIRAEARAFVRSVAMPHEQTLAALATRAWSQLLPGVVWVMPKSHWSYELQFGSQAWLPALLGDIGIDSALLANRNNAAAIEFGLEESGQFTDFTAGLLGHLLGSDFLLAWPGRPVVCTVHHHRQLWWITSDAGLVQRLDQI